MSACVVFLFELFPAPYPLIPAEKPDMLRQIAEDKQDVTVLNLPFGRSDGIQRVGFFNPEAMWLQTIHNKPIIGGYILRMSENDKKMLETGIFRNIVASQTTGIKAKSSKSREEKIKSIIKNLHDT